MAIFGDFGLIRRRFEGELHFPDGVEGEDSYFLALLDGYGTVFGGDVVRLLKSEARSSGGATSVGSEVDGDLLVHGFWLHRCVNPSEMTPEEVAVYVSTPWGRRKLARAMVGETENVTLTRVERLLTGPYVLQRRIRESIRARVSQSVFRWVVTR